MSITPPLVTSPIQRDTMDLDANANMQHSQWNQTNADYDYIPNSDVVIHETPEETNTRQETTRRHQNLVRNYNQRARAILRRANDAVGGVAKGTVDVVLPLVAESVGKGLLRKLKESMGNRETKQTPIIQPGIKLVGHFYTGMFVYKTWCGMSRNYIHQQKNWGSNKYKLRNKSF